MIRELEKQLPEKIEHILYAIFLEDRDYLTTSTLIKIRYVMYWLIEISSAL